jgi:ketosteroid isomerase-like protein
MSEENVEVARELGDGFNAFMRGELTGESFAELHDPQVEVNWHDRQTYPDAPQNFRGLPKLMEFAEQYRSTWADLTQQQLALLDAPDDRVLVVIRQSGRGRESGVPIEIHFFEVLTIRDRKVCKVEFFRHGIDALEAAGLSE